MAFEDGPNYSTKSPMLKLTMQNFANRLWTLITENMVCLISVILIIFFLVFAKIRWNKKAKDEKKQKLLLN